MQETKQARRKRTIHMDTIFGEHPDLHTASGSDLCLHRMLLAVREAYLHALKDGPIAVIWARHVDVPETREVFPITVELPPVPHIDGVPDDVLSGVVDVVLARSIRIATEHHRAVAATVFGVSQVESYGGTGILVYHDHIATGFSTHFTLGSHIIDDDRQPRFDALGPWIKPDWRSHMPERMEHWKDMLDNSCYGVTSPGGVA